MSKQESISVIGVITEALGNSIFKAKLVNGHEVIAHLSGKIRLNNIQILPSDSVMIEMSPYDMQKGRIVRRLDLNKKI